ncbi:hypothetical protein FRC09_000072 [Ceratobasidium sp. 395]|nr:hypothetical protein FRC09_000072 [Ceratobasidium sp. 395]
MLFITQTTTSTLAAIMWGKLVQTNHWVIEMLCTLATQWNTNQEVDTALRQRVIEAGPLLMQKIDTARQWYDSGRCYGAPKMGLWPTTSSYVLVYGRGGRGMVMDINPRQGPDRKVGPVT